MGMAGKNDYEEYEGLMPDDDNTVRCSKCKSELISYYYDGQKDEVNYTCSECCYEWTIAGVTLRQHKRVKERKEIIQCPNCGSNSFITSYLTNGFEIRRTCNDCDHVWIETIKDKLKEETKCNSEIRKFKTGATRNVDNNKLDYEGFINPIVEHRFAQYMHKHRKQKDGSIRDSDNWQKGIPKDVYKKSLVRHTIDLWMLLRGGIPINPDDNQPCNIEDLLCAIKFNVNGLLLEILKEKK